MSKKELKEIGNVYADKPNFQSGKSGYAAGRVYDADGLATAVTALGGGMGAKTGLYAVKQIGTKNDSNDGTQPFQQDRVYDSEGISPALQSGLPGGAHKIVASRGRGEGWKQSLEERKDELTNTLTGVEKDNMVSNGTRIRRLTPVECERLQNYPDGYTAIGVNEKGEEVPISDSQRYKVLGDSVTTSVISSIIEKMFGGE